MGKTAVQLIYIKVVRDLAAERLLAVGSNDKNKKMKSHLPRVCFVAQAN